ncbi:hypothetical protein [Pontibacter vulgaris]|uniref:hypothetical protein n=1 Tax=Pontibacter vulgaris TaxID=2905679 RepID=UPI001FA73DD1|nr:hypothetical protein [Pontibacter vulgaris]
MKLLLRTILYFSFLFVPWVARAQAGMPFGARAAGLANASVTHPGLWALQNNVAGIASLTKPQVGVQTSNQFGIRAFNTVALHSVYPTTRYGNYGISISSFGDDLYSQQHIGFGAAHKLGQFSLGAKADVWQVAVQGYGSRKAVTLSIGGQAEIIPDLYFGVHAFNLNQAKLSSFEDERLPTILKAGLAYRPYKKLLLAAETEKQIEFDADFKAGLEYMLLEKLPLRSGFSTQTNQLTFGTGFTARQLQIDYAFSSATLPGNSHHLSLVYTFRTPER